MHNSTTFGRHRLTLSGLYSFFYMYEIDKFVNFLRRGLRNRVPDVKSMKNQIFNTILRLHISDMTSKHHLIRFTYLPQNIDK